MPLNQPYLPTLEPVPDELRGKLRFPLKGGFGALHERSLVAPFRFHGMPQEYRVVSLRECPVPENLRLCDTPEKVADYWRLHVPSNRYYNPDCECAAVLLLNVRRHVKGHCIVATGTLDTLLVHPREVFRLAILTCASAIVLTHNHPSGDPTPSDADIRATHELVRAGQVVKIELLDHVIIGHQKHVSLREMGYLF